MKVRLIVVFMCLFIVVSLISYNSIADELGSRYLKNGTRGQDVEILQENLYSIGYNLAVDGIFGSETDSVVRNFQKDNSLVTDGIVGPKTLAALRKYVEQSIVYVVRHGDTLWDIAQSFGIPYEEIMQLNLLSSTLIYPGDELIISNHPEANAQEYVVKNGENLSVIASKFGLSANDLAKYNQINDPNKIRSGQLLTIPQTAVPVTTTRQQISFVWPLQGEISSSYGWRNHPINKVLHFHGGIDIAAPTGATVRAAASGRIIQAGPMGDYGLGIVIDHGGGYTTWYGHNSYLLVRVGDNVVVNQPIARVGSTGVSTGPHLDFRIKHHNETVDPIKYLP